VQTPLEKYIELIEFWKVNQPAFETHRHPGWQGHHPVPEAFQKISNEHKHEFAKKLEELYHLDETVLVPDRVHFEIHMLLVDVFPNHSQEWFKMSNALNWFLGKRQNKFDITPEEYEKTRLLYSEAKHTTKLTAEQRKAISDGQRGKCHSKEWRENIRIAQNRPDVRKRKIESHKETLRKHPEINEQRSKSCSESWTQERRDQQSIVSKEMALSEEFLLKRNKSIKDAHSDPIVKAKYSGKNHGQARACEQWTKDGVLIARYDTIAEAGNKTKIGHISDVLRGKRKTASGFIWRYAEKKEKS